MKYKITTKKWFLLGTGFFFCAVVTLAFMPLEKEKEVSPSNDVIPSKTVLRKAKIDEKADKILKEMSKNLSALTKFSFTSRGYFELVVDSVVQKIQVTNMGKL